MWPRLNPVVYLITTPISFLYPKCQQSSWYKKNILILSHSYLWKYSVTGSPVVDTRSGANSVRARQNKATSLIGHVISKSHDTLTLFMNDGNFTHIWDMDRGRRTKTWACTTWNCFFYAQGYIETYKKMYHELRQYRLVTQRLSFWEIAECLWQYTWPYIQIVHPRAYEPPS